MNTDRIVKICRMLSLSRRAVPLQVFLDELEISRATFKRDLAFLRDRFGTPIVYDRDAGGYRFDSSSPDGSVYELPGLWFSANELYALLAAHRLLEQIEPGILADHLAPLQSRLVELLGAGGHPVQEIERRVRILSIARRRVEPRFFAHVAAALMRRNRIEIDAWNRARDEVNTRVVSPQRLVHYRDNWYLDAFCHWRGALRSFALDTLRRVRLLPQKAQEISDAQLDAHYTGAYGIFAGMPTAQAVLRFSAERARWVRAEVWHPKQQQEDLPDGGLRLTVPYADERELMMDILRHGRHVTVEAPQSLRQRMAEEVAVLAARYGIGLASAS